MKIRLPIEKVNNLCREWQHIIETLERKAIIINGHRKAAIKSNPITPKNMHDGTVGSVLDLHMVILSSIPCIPYGPELL